MTLSEQFISAPEAGKLLGLTAVRVGVLCRQGRFDGAEKIARNWVIPRSSVENFKRLPPGGSKNLKQQHEEDKAMIERLRESTKKHGNADGENCRDCEG